MSPMEGVSGSVGGGSERMVDDGSCQICSTNASCTVGSSDVAKKKVWDDKSQNGWSKEE